jgi:hypothetical protein
VRDVVTLASVVELETAQAQERPRVAAVFLNRLKKGIPLATDPTIIHALRQAGRWDGNIRRTDLDIDSPYNTYRNAGLPPGPIASPGRASLHGGAAPGAVGRVALSAATTAPHHFSRTFAEHQQAVASTSAPGRPAALMGVRVPEEQAPVVARGPWLRPFALRRWPPFCSCWPCSLATAVSAGAGDARERARGRPGLVEERDFDLDEHPSGAAVRGGSGRASRLDLPGAVVAAGGAGVRAVSRLSFALDETGAALAGKLAASLLSSAAAAVCTCAWSCGEGARVLHRGPCRAGHHGVVHQPRRCGSTPRPCCS